MRILHLLSQTEITGSEVYVKTLVESSDLSANSVWIISDKLHVEIKVPFVSRPISKRSLLQRLKNVLFLRKFIIENQIDVVHTHSRASSWVAYWSTRFLKLKNHRPALVSTIHGRQHESISKKIFDNYGELVIANCQNAKLSLIKSFNMRKDKIITLGNPIKIINPQTKSENKTHTLAIIGRTTGPKGQRVRDLIDYVFEDILKSSNFKISIIGKNPSNLGQSHLDKIKELNRKYNDRIEILDHIDNLNQNLSQFSAIIGAGRVAIESLSQNIATFALGEYSYEGLVTENNYQTARASNFGDIGVDSMVGIVDYSLIKKDLNQFFLNFNETQHLQENQLSELIKHDFSAQKIADEIFSIYKAALFKRNVSKNIPVLMYHKVPDQELKTKHRIFVTKDNFKNHLKIYKSLNLESIDFETLNKYWELKLPYTQFPKKPFIITFDDGYVDNLTNAAPLLKEFGFKACLFLLADKKILSNTWDHSENEPSHPIMTLDQKMKWIDYGFEIGSHGSTHRDMTKLTKSEVLSEMQTSKKQLEVDFNKEILCFAYPYGYSNEDIQSLAKEAGYKFAVNTDSGALHISENPWGIFRINIFPEDRYSQLKKKTSWWYRRYYYLKRKK